MFNICYLFIYPATGIHRIFQVPSHTTKGRFPGILAFISRYPGIVPFLIVFLFCPYCLQQNNAILGAFLPHFIRPDRSLNFADMHSSEEQHAES